jgi:hypothetical protein
VNVMRKLSSILTVAMAIFVSFGAFGAVYVRSYSKAHLEIVAGDLLTFVPNVLFKSLSASMILYQLLTAETAGKYYLLIAARGSEGLGWLVIMYRLLLPINLIAKGRPSVEHVPLSLKLYAPAIGYKVTNNKLLPSNSVSLTINVAVVVLCLWDLSFFPMLPWIRTATTELLNGFPSLATCRICLYAPLVSQTIQVIYSVFLIYGNEGSLADYLFEIATFIYWLYNTVRILLFLQFVRNDRLNLAVINATDLQVLEKSRSFWIGQEDVVDVEPPRINAMHSVAENDNWMEAHHPSGNALRLHSFTASDEGVDREHHSYQDTTLEKVEESHISFEEIQQAENLIKEFSASSQFADETTEILKLQLKKANIQPLVYIPKEKLVAEIDELVAAANQGASFDERRVDYLLQCLDVNPEYQVCSLSSEFGCIKRWCS